MGSCFPELLSEVLSGDRPELGSSDLSGSPSSSWSSLQGELQGALQGLSSWSSSWLFAIELAAASGPSGLSI